MISPREAPRMNNSLLHTFLARHVGNLEGGGGQWRFEVDGVEILCFTDQANDRVRFMAAVTSMTDVTAEELIACMHANFTTALDARYGMARGQLWSLFLHPLSELSETMALSALKQVAALHKNYGGTYSSDALIFQGGYE